VDLPAAHGTRTDRRDLGAAGTATLLTVADTVIALARPAARRRSAGRLPGAEITLD
jgi:hypothetical protein